MSSLSFNSLMFSSVYNFCWVPNFFSFSFYNRIVGNPLICGLKAENNCSAVLPEPLSFPPDALNGIYAFSFLSSSLAHDTDDNSVLMHFWFLSSSIRLWDATPPLDCSICCKLWCCLRCHNNNWVTCLVAI